MQLTFFWNTLSNLAVAVMTFVVLVPKWRIARWIKWVVLSLVRITVRPYCLMSLDADNHLAQILVTSAVSYRLPLRSSSFSA